MDLENLKLLESKIDQFVDQHARTREQQAVLAQRLKEREQQLAEVSGQLQQYELERSEFRARLERILTRLAGLDLG
ncbi:MAG: cell division protein ZapB [Candidatus Binatia bacterium]